MTINRVKQVGWAVNEKLTSAQLNQLDINQAAAIDGAAGGSYAPTGVIAIGGAGLAPTLRATTWPNFAADPGGLRTFTRSFPAAQNVVKLFNGSIVPPGWLAGLANGCVASYTLPVPHTAIIKAITLRLLPTIHTSLPTVGPGLIVTRVQAQASTSWASLSSTDPALPVIGNVPSAGVTLPITTLPAYNALQSLTYTANQNNTVDRSLYTYLVWVVDESGGGAIAGNTFYSIDVTYTLSDFEVA